MAYVHQLTSAVEGIACHAWNGDKTMIAICPNSNEIHIYETRNWTKLYALTEHDLLVTSIDWSAVTNKIVSCSHDRNAFVWTFETDTNTWKPSLVLLRIERAAIDARWALDGLRFAVTSGAKCVPVCTYDITNDWWVCKMIKKKFKSTVLCCAFHPTNAQLLATGCADFKCRVYSTFIADVDGTNVDAGPFTSTNGPVEFGETYCELSSNGWVNAVAWSPSGSTLAYTSQDSTLYVATFGIAAEPPVQVIRLRNLPLCSLLFIVENVIAGAGHDFNPSLYKFNRSQGTWAFHCHLDTSDASSTAGDAEQSNTSRARELFKAKTVRGQDLKSDTDVLKTKHERAINSIREASNDGGRTISTLSTSSVDGKLIVWNLENLDVNFAQLTL